MADDCVLKGKTRWFYTGNQVGDLNYVGDFNYTAGGPPGSGLSAGTTVPITFPAPLNRRPWLKADAKFGQDLLDACYPVIELQWVAEIELDPSIIFRVSDKSVYVQDEDGFPRYYDARCENSPNINITVGEWLQPQFEISDLQLTINNRDGYFNHWLPHGSDYRQWSGAKITIRLGFGEKFSNYMTIFEGFVTERKGMETTRDSIKIVAYDKLDLDRVPIPPSVYSVDTYPDVESGAEGTPVPLVYGDWTVDVSPYGSVEAVCTNATDNLADQFLFKISDIALESIDEIWLHRGQRKEGEPDGPVKVLPDFLIIQPEEGRFIIPAFTPVLESEIVMYDNMSAGAGSGLNLITAKDSSVNFLQRRIGPNDRILKRKTGEYATVISATNTQINLSGGITFTLDDEFVVLTQQYVFLTEDKISIKCKGKNLNLISLTRIPDANIDVTEPTTVSIGFDKTYWIADDATQKIYNFTFGNLTKKVINYSDIDPSITKISGISVASDNKIWAVDPINSIIYRYNLDSSTTGMAVPTNTIVGVSGTLANVTGIQNKLDNNAWIVDQATSTFYEVNFFDAVQPFVENTFDNTAFDSTATEILDVSYDEVNNEVVAVDRTNNKFYRLNEITGAPISNFELTELGSNVSFISGVSVAQDGTIFLVDQETLTVYNYYELENASDNPCIIARDLLQKFGGHTHADFDLTWNLTAVQLKDYKCRAVIDDKEELVKYVSKLLQQYNIAFFVRFGKFALFWIEFSNFTTNGMLVTEKDIKDGSFNPSKEYNQYFNSASASYGTRPFVNTSLTSDTYVSPAGIAFLRKEVTRSLDLPNVYKREDLDKLIPLFIKLSVPEPEFVKVGFGFRLIRSQIHDFLNIWFDGETDCTTGIKTGGRRYNHVPCMIRQMNFNLASMTIDMKLWSLGNTAFAGYTPVGKTVGGQFDTIVLSNLGRPAHIGPIGSIISGTGNDIVIADFLGQNAETRATMATGKAWELQYRVGIYNSITKELLETLIIDSVINDTITFTTAPVTVISPTTYNTAGFITGGHYLAYSHYDDLTEDQKKFYGSYCRPINNYPVTRTQEIEEQRGGIHSFDDQSLPYILYPVGFINY